MHGCMNNTSSKTTDGIVHQGMHACNDFLIFYNLVARVMNEYIYIFIAWLQLDRHLLKLYPGNTWLLWK